MDLDDDEDVEDALGLISTTNLIYERRHALRIEPSRPVVVMDPTS